MNSETTPPDNMTRCPKAWALENIADRPEGTQGATPIGDRYKAPTQSVDSNHPLAVPMVDTVTTLDGRVIGKPKQRKHGLDGQLFRGDFRQGETVELPGTDDQGRVVTVVCKVGRLTKKHIRLHRISAHRMRQVEIPIEGAE